MTPEASVVIVSRERGTALALTLDALRFQSHPRFEVIVVGDKAAKQGVVNSGLSDVVSFIAFDRPGVSAARNAGIAVASAPILAFLDDDAVPDPGWLLELTSALESSGAAYAAGFVRGPDGLSTQFRGEWLLKDGTSLPLTAAPTAPKLIAPDANRVLGVMGTNMAFRNDTLDSIGGFDSAFEYYLDDSDVAWRLGQIGHAGVLVPDAQVLHGMLPSGVRGRGGLPSSLAKHGSSVRHFLSKHDPERMVEGFQRHDAVFRARLGARMLKGSLYPDQMMRLMRSFRSGTESSPPYAKSVGEPETSNSLFPALGKSVHPVIRNTVPHKAHKAGEPIVAVLSAPRCGSSSLRYQGSGMWIREVSLRERMRIGQRLAKPGLGIQCGTLYDGRED